VITERELKLLRAEQEKFMPNRCTIRRRSYVGGEDEYVPSIIFEDKPCRLWPGFGIWRQTADRFQGITAYTVTLPYGSDIRAGDELIDEESRTYQVRDALSPKSYETAVRALLDLVTD